MKKAVIKHICKSEMDCPKEVVMWNYYDHEHLIGTHYKLYENARVLAERDDWALVYRKPKVPILPFYNAGIALQYMKEKNIMRTIHKDSIGLMLDMEVLFEDLPVDRCLITVTYTTEVPAFLMFILEPIFKTIFQNWFEAAWEEDKPMRLRRWKMHQLGFKDFHGIDYINKKDLEPEKKDYSPYEFTPPIASLPQIKALEGMSRPFKKSVELGY